MLHALAARLAALRTPLPEYSSDFGLLCAQVYASSGHRSSLVDLQQYRARLQPAPAQRGRSARFRDQVVCVGERAYACEESGDRSTAYGARAAGRTRFT